MTIILANKIIKTMDPTITVLEKHAPKHEYFLKNTPIVVKFTPYFSAIGKRILYDGKEDIDDLVPLDSYNESYVYGLNIKYKFQDNFDFDKDNYTFANTPMYANGTKYWCKVQTNTSVFFVNKSTGIRCNCSGCSFAFCTEIMHNEWDSITIKKTKNFINGHCIYCSCGNCVCEARKNAKLYGDALNIPFWEMPCEGSCLACINMQN